MNLAEIALRNARLRPHDPAVMLGLATVTDHRRFARRVAALAGTLAGRFALAPGDRVAMAMSNGPEFLEVMFATWWAGGVVVPVNAKLHPAEIAYMVEQSGARLAFVSDDLAAAVGGALAGLPDLVATIAAPSADYARMTAGDGPERPAERAAGDLAWLFYTSGTTGRPKGAMLTHRNLTVMITSHLADVAPVDPVGAVLHAAPMSHGSGMVGLVHAARGAAQLIPESRGFDVDETAAIVRARREVGFFAAPTMVNRLVRSDALDAAAVAGLGTIVYGGAPMYVDDLKHAVARLGPKLAQIYGQGEAPMTITALPAAMHVGRDDDPGRNAMLASVGVPRTGVEASVRGDAGPLATGETGEVCVRGDIVMAGYWRNAEATAAAIPDGWLLTGDVGSFDDRGLLTLRDRSKDVIISGGSNIYPREVEEVLVADPSVAEVSVIGAPDPDWGEVVVAFVVGAPGAAVDPAALDRLCLARIARFKRPKRYEVVEALPKNSYGKVLKRALRERLEAEERA